MSERDWLEDEDGRAWVSRNRRMRRRFYMVAQFPSAGGRFHAIDVFDPDACLEDQYGRTRWRVMCGRSGDGQPLDPPVRWLDYVKHYEGTHLYLCSQCLDHIANQDLDAEQAEREYEARMTELSAKAESPT